MTKKKVVSERASYYKQIIKLLTPSRKKIYYTQLMDGRIFIYDRNYLLASFGYVGGRYISNLKLNTKKYIDTVIGDSLQLEDSYMERGTELKQLLDKLFPLAIHCHPNVKHAYEFSIIEACLLDPSTIVELSRKTQFGCDVALTNVEGYVSSSFRYFYTHRLKYIFVRYHSRKPDVRLKEIIIPSIRREKFIEALDRGVWMD
jgi:hypothetical protein